MTRGEALKTLIKGLKDDIPFFMTIDGDMNMISVDMAIAIWEKLSEEIPATFHPKKEPKKVEPVKIKVPKAEKPVKAEEPKRKTLDDGKIKALRKAGWSLEKIADEMGVSAQTISNHLNKA